MIITLGCLPYKAYISIKAILKTIYRLNISKKHLLEWTTSEEAEKLANTDVISYYKNMFINVIFGIVCILIYIKTLKLLSLLLGILWIFVPLYMCYISKEKEELPKLEKLTKSEQTYILEIARKTWGFFEKYINKENNFLIPDNYQEDRKQKIVKRTSSTNIGLSLLAVISASDLGFIKKK